HSTGVRGRSNEQKRESLAPLHGNWPCLVPKLCLGTRVLETPFHVRPQNAKRSFPECVPKQSLGTRKGKVNVPCFLVLFYRVRTQEHIHNRIALDMLRDSRGRTGPTP